MKILLADDEKELIRALNAILIHAGYETECVYDGAEAVRKALSSSYDAMIFDVMMPEKDGITALQELREHGIDTPVLLLTAKAEIDDRIAGLDAGANDYLTKPFAMGELLARIRAMTRHSHASDYSGELRFANITLSRESYELKTEKSSFRLGKKEFAMMEMLIHEKGKTIANAQILERIWNDDEDADEDAVYLYISYLRKKLKALGANLEITGSTNSGWVLEESA